VTFAGSMQGGSIRLLARPLDATAGSGGTLTLAGVNTLAARMFLGAAPTGAPGVPGGVLRVTNAAALGTAGVQIDADGSSIQLDGASTGLFIPASNLFLRGGGADGIGALHNAAGANRLGGHLALLADATINVASGSSLDVSGDLADLSVASSAAAQARLVLDGGGTLTLRRLARFNLDSGTYTATTAAGSALARVEVRAGTLRLEDRPGIHRPDQTSVVRELSIAGSARLDLGDSALVVDYSSSSPLAEIRGWIATGFAGGAWNGPGIASSSAAFDWRAGLAYAESTQWPATLLSGFAGRQVDATSVLVGYALFGDTDISGRVDLSDFAALASHFNSAGTWADGDFTYDGSITIADFARLAQNFNVALDVATARPVPEPGAAMSLLAGACLSRRQRRRC